MPEDVEEKLGWIPGLILTAYSPNDMDLRLRILQVRQRLARAPMRSDLWRLDPARE